MIQLAIIVGCMLGSLALMCAVFAVRFVAALLRWPRPALADADLPPVVVLLSLRGVDTSLAEGLRHLLQQHYPYYEVRIVIDQSDDPAWDVVQQVIKETGAVNVHVSLLRERLETCSVKNSALVQMVAEADEAYEVVALLNGNVTPHAEWLRELVSPLLEEGIGATYGNLWCMPEEGHLGSLVRYVWNAASLVFKYHFGIPWGGTFAIHRSVMHRSGLVDKWAHAIVDDAPVRNTLQKLGLRVKFVPPLLMVNREECDLAFSLDFMMRRMAWGRVYNVGWVPTVSHALITTGGLALAAALVPWGLATGQLEVLLWAGGGLVCYWLTMLGLLGLLEHGVRRTIRARGEPIIRFTWSRLAKVILAIPVAQGLHLVAVLLAACKRHITWRGVTYRIRGPWDIRLVRY